MEGGTVTGAPHYYEESSSDRLPFLQHLVHLDRPDGLFSTMNVDKVNLKKYPGLEQVHYQISELHGGDCIFVPYKW